MTNRAFVPRTARLLLTAVLAAAAALFVAPAPAGADTVAHVRISMEATCSTAGIWSVGWRFTTPAADAVVVSAKDELNGVTPVPSALGTAKAYQDLVVSLPLPSGATTAALTARIAVDGREAGYSRSVPLGACVARSVGACVTEDALQLAHDMSTPGVVRLDVVGDLLCDNEAVGAGVFVDYLNPMSDRMINYVNTTVGIYWYHVRAVFMVELPTACGGDLMLSASNGYSARQDLPAGPVDCIQPGTRAVSGCDGTLHLKLSNAAAAKVPADFEISGATVTNPDYGAFSVAPGQSHHLVLKHPSGIPNDLRVHVNVGNEWVGTFGWEPTDCSSRPGRLLSRPDGSIVPRKPAVPAGEQPNLPARRSGR